MPVFTNPIQSQNQATAAGKQVIPLYQLRQNSILSDIFDRETLQPTNTPVIYTETALSTGSSSLPSGTTYRLTTAATLNDYMTSRISSVLFVRSWFYPEIEARTQLIFDASFVVVTTTNVQVFFGLATTNAAMTSLPTTSKHVGLYYDTSVDTKMRLTSADGTTQSKTVFSNTITGRYRFRAVITGDDTATLTVYDSTDALLATQTITSLLGAGNSASTPFQWQFFVKALAGAATSAQCDGWQIQAL